MNFLLSGKDKQHAIYDDIVKDCEQAIRTSTNYRDSIIKRFLFEKSDREERKDVSAKNCSYKQLNHLLADLFGASLDTTLCTLRWLLLILAIHDDCQKKIYEEMKAYGVKEKYLLEDIDSLPYLKASIAESMRLKSVVSTGIPHGNKQDTTLGGYFIPKNSMVIYNTFFLN